MNLWMQMSTYYAPAFFAHLLGRCFQRRSPVVGVMRLGVMVLATFAVCWWPFLSSWQSVLQVLSRLAPLERGLYEDYVANFWCSTSLLVKWKQLFSIPMLARLAMGMTIGASLPSMVQQILAPSAEGFLFSMLNSSFAFYLFAFQVHEKSVLLPVLPATLLALNEPQVLQYIVPIAVMSMLPLLRRDGLIIPYFALLSLFFLLPAHPVYGPQGKPNKQKGGIVKSSALNLLPFCSISGAVVLHLIYLFLHPPARYPFLFEALITVYCFAHFLALAIYTNWRQWFQPVDRAEVSADKEE
jgi:alpha-1,3-glucosyltransferase